MGNLFHGTGKRKTPKQSSKCKKQLAAFSFERPPIAVDLATVRFVKRTKFKNVVFFEAKRKLSNK
jgi:hypothetical protein